MSSRVRTAFVLLAVVASWAAPAVVAAAPVEESPPPATAPVAEAEQPPAPARGHRLAAGSGLVGGTVSAGYRMAPGDGGNFQLLVAPEGGYVVVDGLALAAELGVQMPSSGGYSRWILELVLGAKYYFDCGAVLPYAGLLAGGLVYTARGNDNVPWYLFDVRVPLGVLVPLDENVALDVGLRGRFSVGGGHYEIARMIVVGIQASL